MTCRHAISRWYNGVYVYGAQLKQEATPQATYQPMERRLIEGRMLAIKTSATALIGQTEGTLFVEARFVKMEDTILY